jgi:hypothetical protein
MILQQDNCLKFLNYQQGWRDGSDSINCNTVPFQRQADENCRKRVQGFFSVQEAGFPHSMFT